MPIEHAGALDAGNDGEDFHIVGRTLVVTP